MLSATKCPEGFDRFQEKCYKIFSEVKAFDDARNVCQNTAKNYDLAVIHGSPLNAFVLQKLKSTTSNNPNDVWIGLSDKVNEGTFVWVNGSPLTHGSNWETNEPSTNDVRQLDNQC